MTKIMLSWNTTYQLPGWG